MLGRQTEACADNMLEELYNGTNASELDWYIPSEELEKCMN